MNAIHFIEKIAAVAEGIQLRAGNFNLALSDNNILSITGWTSTLYFENINKNNVMRELSELKEDFMKLSAISPELLELIKRKDLSTEFRIQFDEYGKGGILICSEINGQINWHIKRK